MPLPILIQKSAGRQYPLAAVLEFGPGDFATGEATPAIQLPGDSIVVGGEIIVRTAFNTANTLSLGDAGSATRYLSAQALTSVGRTALTLTGFVHTAPVNLIATRAGTPDGGAGILIVQYIMLDRATETQSAREGL